MQMTLNNINKSAAKFGMHFAPSKCKVLLQDWSGPNPNLILAGQSIEVVDKFTYLGSFISPEGLIKDDVTLRIGKARADFSSLQHLWRRLDSLSIKGRVYEASMRSVLLYGSETWALRKGDLRKLTVFDHWCLRSIARIW